MEKNYCGTDMMAGGLIGLILGLCSLIIPIGLGAFWKEGEVVTKPYKNPYKCIKICNERIDYFEIQRGTAQNILMKGLNR